MAEIPTSDGTQIFYKDWGAGQPIKCSSSCSTATGSSPTIGAGMAARPRSARATTWTITPTTWLI
jgi:hypothetical protein